MCLNQTCFDGKRCEDTGNMYRSTWNPFRSLLVTPTELHAALGNPAPSPRRIVPVAAGRDTALESFQTKHIPGSVYTSMKNPLMIGMVS